MTLDLVLIWALRAIGILWLLGGAFVIREMWLARSIDRAIDRIEDLTAELSAGDQPMPAAPEDRGRQMWLLTGGILTFIAGAALVAGSPLSLIPLTLLIIHQVFYLIRQARRVRQARSDEEAEDAKVTISARNGALTALAVWVVSLTLHWRDYQAIMKTWL